MSKKSTKVEDEDSKSVDDSADSDQDSAIYDVKYDLDSMNSNSFTTLKNILSKASYITPKNSMDTNIIDLRSGKTYNIPDEKRKQLFEALENCRKEKIKTMIYERHQEYSGIMIDLDMYQDTDKDQITDEMLQILCKKVVEQILLVIKYHTKEKIYVAIIRKPKIKFNSELKVYKDGLHILIPSIKVKRQVKILLNKRLHENEIMEKVFADVVPANIKIKEKQYTVADFLDKHCSYVNTTLLGSSSKRDSPAYKISHVYEMKVIPDDIIVNHCDKLKSDKYNLVYEYSLNWECPGGIIKKNNYEISDNYVNQIAELKNVIEEDDFKNHSSMSLYSLQDVQAKELKEYIDTMNPSRAHYYDTWFKVICALAYISPTYVELARYFSMKSNKYNAVDFTRIWNSILHSKSKNPSSIGTIKHYASLDNPERYAEIQKTSIFNVLYKMVYSSYREGILGHSDIAEILHIAVGHKYHTDIPQGEKKMVWYEFIFENDPHKDGELFKWRRWDDFPVSLSKYISYVLPNLCNSVLTRIKEDNNSATGNLALFYKNVLKNFKATMRNFSSNTYKKSVINEASIRFNKVGFADSLDKDPLIRGVSNGVLKLATGKGKPLLLTGYHGYAVSRYTKVPYIPFNPFDEITIKIMGVLRSIFPDDEPDSHEYTLTYLSSTIDGNPKASLFMIMPGSGSNSKSTILELHKEAIGDTYGVKIPLSHLTSRDKNSENATPAMMMLKDATFAYYSESNANEILNAAKIKEMTGQETLSGRKLHQDMVNFKPRCHHLVTTNHDFDIESNDYGIWRRICYNRLKMIFVAKNGKLKFDPNNPFHRHADPDIQEKWTEDKEILGRYLGYLVWFHYHLFHKYDGHINNVSHPHIEFETNKYENRQNIITEFLTKKCVKSALDADGNQIRYDLVTEIQKYVNWYKTNYNKPIIIKGLEAQFQNSKIRSHIQTDIRGNSYLVGHRFLDIGETIKQDEIYSMSEIVEFKLPEDNFGIQKETVTQYIARVQEEFTMIKHIFNNQDDTVEIKNPSLNIVDRAPDNRTTGIIKKIDDDPIIKDTFTNEDFKLMNAFITMED